MKVVQKPTAAVMLTAKKKANVFGGAQWQLPTVRVPIENTKGKFVTKKIPFTEEAGNRALEVMREAGFPNATVAHGQLTVRYKGKKQCDIITIDNFDGVKVNHQFLAEEPAAVERAKDILALLHENGIITKVTHSIIA